MSTLIRGRIVFPIDAVPDPLGVNPKPNRPFVVLSTPDEIKRGDDLKLVGITKDVTNAPDRHFVRLPWGPHALTGLKVESVALCVWTVLVPQDRVTIGKCLVRPKELLEIEKKLRDLTAAEGLQADA